MPDIGTTLRETRMRQRIDITSVEAATKIRAKYLRALENEEWDLLPGPTFVRTFLRTYGDFLGLDSKMLVEEYKQRFERPGPQDLLPFHPRGSGRRQRRAWAIPPFVLVGLCVAALVAVLFGLGTLGGDEPGGGDGGASGGEPGAAAATPATATATPATSAAERRRARERRRRAASVVRLRIQPTGLVNVCLVSGVSGRVLIPGENLAEGATTRVFEAPRLRVTFGNGNATMRISGRPAFDVPDTDEPLGYDLRPGRRPQVLTAGARPTCER